MTGFELRTSKDGGDGSTNWAKPLPNIYTFFVYFLITLHLDAQMETKRRRRLLMHLPMHSKNLKILFLKCEKVFFVKQIYDNGAFVRLDSLFNAHLQIWIILIFQISLLQFRVLFALDYRYV